MGRPTERPESRSVCSEESTERPVPHHRERLLAEASSSQRGGGVDGGPIKSRQSRAGGGQQSLTVVGRSSMPIGDGQVEDRRSTFPARSWLTRRCSVDCNSGRPSVNRRTLERGQLM